MFEEDENLSRKIAETFSAYGRECEDVSFSVSVKIVGAEVNLLDEGDLEGLMGAMEPGREVKRCPDCGRVSFGGATVCPECGHEFRYEANED